MFLYVKYVQKYSIERIIGKYFKYIVHIIYICAYNVKAFCKMYGI